jgi:Zn-dependent protease with chaperone function
MNTINFNKFSSELQREALPLQIVNKCAGAYLIIRDVITCIPRLYKGVRSMIALQKKLYELPDYIPLNQKSIDNFQAFPDEMSGDYRISLIENLKAIDAIREKLQISGKVYYFTKAPPTITSAEALATGEIIIYDEICTSTPQAAQACFLHEWTHILHKDGYCCWSLKIAAAALTIFTFCYSPLSLPLAGPLLSYGTIKYSQYCERRADKNAVRLLGDASALADDMLKEAEYLTVDVLKYIEKNNPRSYCSLSNYNRLSRQEQIAIILKISDLGIRSLSLPSFNHPSYAERYRYLSLP